MKLIEFKDISKSYENQIIFENVSFSIREKEKIAILGHNGSGKLTFLKIIEGLECPDIGVVYKDNNLKISSLNQIDFFPVDLKVEDILNQVFSHTICLEEKLNILT